jgi:hypothetical protein
VIVNLKEFEIALTLRSGGRGRDRTGDPLLAKQVLSQLSYTPYDYTILIDFRESDHLLC